MSTWQQYQTEAASLFRSLGLQARVEATTDGARGKHRVDVLVEGSIYGVPVRWVVECKDWQTKVPKEKALALLSIVQDVGADRGFLLSEVGFQPGAIATVQRTNVTLTSIAELREAASTASAEAAIAILRSRLLRVQENLRDLIKAQWQTRGQPEFRPYFVLTTLLAVFDEPLRDADLGSRKPVTLRTENRDTGDGVRTLITLSFEEFLDFARITIGDAEACAERGGSAAP
jgi:hypothetical protein